MNCLVFPAVLAAFVSLLLGPDTCQALPRPGCDLEDCAIDCTELGALRWSCEEEGCMCTFLLEDAKALELGEEMEGEGKDAHKEASPKEKYSSAKDKERTGKDKGSPESHTGASSPTGAAQNLTQGRPSNAASIKTDEGQNGTGQKKVPTTKIGRKKAKKPEENYDGAKLTLVDSAEASKKPDNKGASQADTGEKDMGGISLLSRKALEPDREGKGKSKSNFKGRVVADSSNLHVPFLVRSLERPLSKKQVMEQIKKQKGDIPMKEIEEFIMKG